MKLHRKAETESTNLDARGSGPGEVFAADWQRTGRGRLDHRWESPCGVNLMFSAVLDGAGREAMEIATLPLVVGLAVRSALARETAAELTIKWPNDILADGMKLAGILCERDGDNVIAGVGINVNQTEFSAALRDRATSLARLNARASDRDRVLDSVLASIEAYHARWVRGGFAALHPEFAAVDHLRGRVIGVQRTDGDAFPVRGICGGIAVDGSLEVDGERVYSGEAHVELPSPREAYLLAGPTASGKSAIAAELAREMGAWILSADSMLVYRGMDIGTAKPSVAEREEFHMGGVDIVTPAEEFSSGAWLRSAAKWLAEVPRERPVIIVGGTGLYFSALLRGLDREWTKPAPAYPVIRIDRTVVRERIAARLDDMFMAGLEDERRRLHAEYPVWSKTAALAIGYREGDDREKIRVRTCQLAKRQDTWFRHQATPLYVEPTVESVRECWRTHGPWKIVL